jgi:hypothetical protein
MTTRSLGLLYVVRSRLIVAATLLPAFAATPTSGSQPKNEKLAGADRTRRGRQDRADRTCRATPRADRTRRAERTRSATPTLSWRSEDVGSHNSFNLGRFGSLEGAWARQIPTLKAEDSGSDRAEFQVGSRVRGLPFPLLLCMSSRNVVHALSQCCACPLAHVVHVLSPCPLALEIGRIHCKPGEAPGWAGGRGWFSSLRPVLRFLSHKAWGCHAGWRAV